MIDTAVLLTFIPTFFFVSITPGLCMTLALTLGMSIGVRRTMWMMLGEVFGVAIVAIASVAGVASIMINHPELFNILKVFGACYLSFTAWQMWNADTGLQNTGSAGGVTSYSNKKLVMQGMVTALANPKGWAFMISLLPPFINTNTAVTPQLTVLVLIIMLSEFFCMLIYANGGKKLTNLLAQDDNMLLLNRISASLIFVVAVWLVLS